ncbi:MAG TPA: alanine racemase [Tepidimicrobium sp.]|nr:alanine racemase [Tepidimicrobium sp.]
MRSLDEVRPTWAEIDLNNLAHNIGEVRRLTKKDSLVTAVVKADAYGHGAIEAGEIFLQNGADRLSTATLSEAIELRNGGIDAPILVMGYTPITQYPLAIEHDIILTIYDYESAKALSQKAIEANKKATIHIKIDSGMGRIGFLPKESSADEIVRISRLSNLNVEGMFTHFATADEADKGYTKIQYNRYMNMVNMLKSRGLDIPIKHVSNSAAIIDCSDYNLDMVRGGIMTYGHWPSEEVNQEGIILKPAMTLKTKVAHVKRVPRGTGISYGQIFTTKRESIIATLPIGYADGFTRMLVPDGEVFIKGKRVPVAGRICMDQCMIDVTEVEGVEVGDEVVIFGHGEGHPTVEEIAKKLGTINYEILCMVGRRVPRVYVRDGDIVKTKDYLLD